MNLAQEISQTLYELNKAQIDLAKLELKPKRITTTSTKIYRKLSDIEVLLSKIDCNLNEQRKLNRFIAKMTYYNIRLWPYTQFVEHDKVTDKFWREFLNITD